jgi:5-methylcytosine-specific restriction endonuclease McrA
MPIRPEHRWLYPIDWRELSAVIRFTRARGQCERCGRPHGQMVRHLGDGHWWDEARGCWRDARGRRARIDPPRQLRLEALAGAAPLATTRVVLASAHLDHDPGNNHPRNLAALCQRCHLAHDRAEHRRRRWTTLFRRRALGDLFLGSYR